MRRITGMALAVGIIVAAAAGCGITASRENMAQKLKTEASALDTTNYESKAMMTVQMDNSSQTYYVETAYDSANTYRIKLGDANKNINQIIVRNESGMFIVSPSLQKVFRFNGNWAQNQGHIYLYDQILQTLASSKDLKTATTKNGYTMEIPTSSGSDVISKEQVMVDKNLHPKKVVLFNQAGKAVVTVTFTSFTTDVEYKTADFDPHQIVSKNPASKTTLASMTSTSSDIGYVQPANALGDTLMSDVPLQPGGHLLRYTGPHNFVLNELPPMGPELGYLRASMVDLYGVPAIYSDLGKDKELVWLTDGIEFNMVSNNMTMDQMQKVAISTMGQVTK